MVAYRWDINISGFLVVMPYAPGQAIAYGLTAFSLGVKYLRVVDHSLIEKEHKAAELNSTETASA